MKPWTSPHLPILACALVLLAGGHLNSQTTDPAEAKLRALLDAKLQLKSPVFAAEAFPICDFEQPEMVAELLGPYTVKVTWYDGKLQPASSAKSPGVYGAVIEVTPKAGRPLRRYATAYRTAVAIDPANRFKAEASDDFARQAGLDAAIIKQEAKLIGESLKDRPFSEWSTDPRSARLLAGLSQAKATGSPARKNEDAFALERQYWVGLKRQLNGFEAKPFVSPWPLEGKPATVVHEGTLAEAGMKADAADKINAVLETWAADDDQAFAVCIVRHGVIVLHKAYGSRDGQPMTVTTKSWMASITKTMSASLMWTLIDQGVAELDDPIEKYLPALRDAKVAKPITIRHLYTHTSGLSLDKWPGWHDDLPDVELRVADYVDRLRVAQEFGYGGTGNMLGGKIIENRSGEAVPLFFQKHLLEPLGMTNTDVLGTHADAQSVPLDMAKFGQLLLNKGAYGQMRFFREETFQKMLPQPLATIGPDIKRTFGIGLDGRPEKFGHGAASAATFSVDLTEDLVVVMTRNKMGKNQDRYNGKFWDAIKNGMSK